MEGKKVYIPKNITVHLGDPHDLSVQNVTVPYVDYIKNVTSSEIYSTWPENAILANMYCIISLSLNRIYTEWYRAKGYNFDITNNTRYDQYFVFGRNIFENISRLADENFNTYARRKGRQNPYYTEYCNGSTVSCPGLKQWGTVELANKGYTPLEILHYYYPKDLELVRTDDIEGITESYPGTPLKKGDSNENVRLMKVYLARIRINFPIIPSLNSQNPLFDDETVASVRTFQRINNLEQSGQIDRATWYKIISIFNGVTKLAELGSEGFIVDIGENPPNVVLKYGDKNSDVTQMQFIINYLSSYYPTIDSLVVDDYFGEVTRKAVRSVQKTFDLFADGICGKTTWKILYDAYKGIKDNTKIPGEDVILEGQQINAPKFNETLYPGDRGDLVRTIQEYLQTISKALPQIPYISADGIYGQAMREAVKSFQKLFGLKQTGFVDEFTYQVIVEEYSEII